MTRLVLVLALVLLGGCGRGAARRPAGREVAVTRQDLVLDIEVSGALQALAADPVGVPALATALWEFKITWIVPEGTPVKAGDRVLVFDGSELEKKIADRESHLAALTEELGKTSAQSALDLLQIRQERADAEAGRGKAERKAEKPPDLVDERTLRSHALERDLKQREVLFRGEREAARRAQARADLTNLDLRLRDERRRLTELKAQLASLTVQAARPGTVVYTRNWQGDKRKPGDTIWRGSLVLEIVSLERMAAQGFVHEIDASKVAPGQKVGLRLEAHPEKEFVGQVARVVSLVRTESPESKVKVVPLDITLQRTDALLMRPNMRVRGRIEIARLPGVLQIPIAAVETTAQGPVVLAARSRGQVERVPVRLGRRGREAVEVLSGLQDGDRVLLRQRGDGAAPKDALRLGTS